MSLNTFECFVPKYKRNGDIRFLRYLYLINAFCGFMPFYDFEERRLKSGLFYKIHPIFTVIIRIAFATFLIIELQKMDVYSEMIQRTLFYLENTAILCVSIIPTVQLTIFKRKSLRDLFGNFHKTDDVIANLKETSAITTDNGFFDSFLIEIVVFQLIFSALLIANFCLKPMNMSTTYTFSIIGAILLIMNQLFLYLMCNIALALRSRFQHLNDMILNLTKCDLTTMTLKSMQVHGFFTTLLETVYMYNDIFGWSILLFVAAMFVGFLNCFANLMTINEIDHMALENFAAIVILLVMGIILMVCGDMTNCEIKRTQHVSLTAITNLPDKSVSAKSISYVAMQISLEQPQLTAANLFPLTLSTLLTLFGSLTSYMIIIIQFYMK